MMHRTWNLIGLALVTTGAAGAVVPAQAGESGDISAITTLSAEKLKVIDENRRSHPGVGWIVTSPTGQAKAAEYQKVLQAGDVAAVARSLVGAYRGDGIADEMEGLAMACLLDAGYKIKRSPWEDRRLHDKLLGAKKPDEKKLAASVLAIVDAIEKTGHQAAGETAVEFLLQVSTEGLSNLHNLAGNGMRKAPYMPHDVMARAAAYLDSDDPFVRAMAEWAVSASVCNETDQSKARAWPGKDPPAWYVKWAGIPASDHLDLDYARQAMTLGMHRRGKDLLVLARDQARRARERAAWARPRLTKAEADRQRRALAAMGDALDVLASAVTDAPARRVAWRKAFLAFRHAVRDVVLIGPDLDFEKIVYVERFSSGFHLQPGVHGRHHPAGGDIYVQTGLDPDSPREAVIGDQLSRGYVQDLDMWWDGTKVCFSYPDGGRLQKIYEIGLDGRGLRQITDGKFHDVDPTYLPDGSIAFGSTRAEAGIMCAGGLGGGASNGDFGTWNSAHTNIYLIGPDGKVIRLSYCKDDDAYPQCLNDGRVVYMRWDYQERDVNEIFSLWAVRPDGSGSDGFYKVHVPKGRTIQALRDPKPIEGHQLLVAAGSGHYSWCEGTLALCDLTMGINDANGITDVCPQASLFNHGTGETQAVPEGGVPYIGGLYAKPHGLSDKSFFVSASYDNPVSNNHAAYYVDVWGNKELIRRHHLMEVMCVVPVKQRQRPPVIPSMRDESVNHATCYVDNVYNDLPGIEAGQVKYIRICQQMFWIRRAGRPGLQWHPLSNAGECFGYGGTGGPVRVVGTVPVEKDGSAKFQVPSGIDLYFQALDENYMSLQRMRTHVEFAPGENRGCIGCHETRSDVVPVRRKGLAMAKDAVRPTPPPWGDTTLINYEKMIQPIFEAKCVKCHGPEDPKAGLDLSAKKDKYGFMQSYRSLFGLKASDETPRVFWDAEGNAHRPRKRSHDHPWWDKMFQDVIVRGGTDGRVTEPKQFGAHKCPLTLKFVTDAKHRKLLTEKEMQLLSCWVDVQVPYFDTYMQSKGRRGLVRVKVTPHPPFGDSREHDAEYFGK